MTATDPENCLFELTDLPWVAAKEVWLRGEKYMSVYRSLWVRDTDPVYEPVAHRLRTARLITHEKSIEDEDMMFGRAEWLLYQL